MATLLALVVPPIAQALYWLDYVLLSWTIGVVRTFADFPLADIAVAVDERLIAMYFAGLIGWVIMEGTQPEWWRQLTGFVQRQTVIAAALAGGALLIALQVLVFIDRPDGRLHVWFLDVGHSNGVLIQTPGGAQILVDGGRFPSRLLTALGDRIPLTDRQLELVVVTQPDPFDYGAVPAVLRRYDAGAVFINGQPNESAEYSELLDVAAAFPIVNARTGQRITFDDGVTLEVLYPSQAPDLRDGIDDGPVVLRLQYGSISVLLPSDIDSEAQTELLAEGIWPLATVMQMPDHATARSLDRTFVNAVQPSLAVVQADRANRRGDPNADVLALLPEETQILRTDTGGTIHLWTDGTRLWSAQEDD
jgi:competence protein ComEC